tara:strand:- start:723 stop:1412 length:690 start_codon:yes stop_codon:yes gene_type:complete
MKYYKIQYITDKKLIGASYPQCTNILDEYKVDTNLAAERLMDYEDNPTPLADKITLEGLIVKSKMLTDVISSTIVRNNTFIVSKVFLKEFNSSLFGAGECVNILNSNVSVYWKSDKADYKIIRVLPINYESYIDFDKSTFYAGIGGLGDDIGFKSYKDFVFKNKNDVRWSMVFGKTIVFKKKLNLDIVQFGKICRKTFVSEKFKIWYLSNKFTGLDFIEAGNDEYLTCS